MKRPIIENKKVISYNNINLKQTSTKNLLLLPNNFNIKEHTGIIDEILKRNNVFKKLYKLEKSIQTILTSIEETGLLIAGDWFRGGLEEKRTKLQETIHEINKYINESTEIVDQHLLNSYWQQNQLYPATTFEEFSYYRHLHPTYKLMLQYKKHFNYLKQWDSNLRNTGIRLSNDDVVIKGKWRSFSSYTGRITAKNLPLTSMPKAMRDYIVTPKGFELMSVDLSNAELRFLAYYARCNSLMERFNVGKDIHSETAKLIQNKINNLAVKDEQARELAKRYTYSFLYGAGVKTIQKSLQKVFIDITSADVVTINDAFIQQYPEIQNFILERENSEILLTAYGGIKPIATFHKAQRRNFALQSSVSVAIKLLLVALARHHIKIVHILHDEIWILVPKETNTDNFIKQAVKEFEEKITSIFPGFPMNGMLTKEIIGGNYND